MEYDFIKKGRKVRYTWYNWDHYRTQPPQTVVEIVTVAGRPRNIVTKKFVSVADCYYYDNVTEVLCEFEGGFKEYVVLEKLSLYNEIHDLSDEELCRLFNGCVIGSIYLADYDNEFGVDRRDVHRFIEGFCEGIGWDDDLCRACNFVDFVRNS